MYKYNLLTESDRDKLRCERIAILEGEHFRLSLQLIEATPTDPDGESIILNRQADLERRISLHRNKVSYSNPVDTKGDANRP